MLERHTGKGLRVAQGLSPGWQPSFTPSSAQKERCFAVYQDSFYPVPAATGLPWITGVHKVTSSPLLHTTMLMFLCQNFLAEALLGWQHHCSFQ